MLTFGCEKRPIGGTTAPADTTAEQPADTTTEPAEEPSGTAIPQPVDGRDDPAAPREFPRSSEVGTWIKVEPVRVAAAADMAGLLANEDLTRVLGNYHVKRAARAAYKSLNAAARVALVETESPADAFGAFSILYPHAGCSIGVDGSLRATTTTAGGLQMAACQGSVLLLADCTLDDAEKGKKECERLVGRAIFSIIAADPPVLAMAAREVQASQCDLWLVRSASLLTKLDQPILHRLNAAELNNRLGLTGDAVLSVIAVSQKQDDPITLIWLVEYPDAGQARAAAERYKQATRAAGESTDKTTIVGNPTGRYLMGSWTGQQEVARDMVRSLEQALAEP
jgi:hypothetical protein